MNTLRGAPGPRSQEAQGATFTAWPGARYHPARRRGGALRAAFPCAHRAAHHDRALKRTLFTSDLTGEATATGRLCWRPCAATQPDRISFQAPSAFSS